MRVRELPDAAEFLAATHDLRAADPVRTNILGSIARSVADGARTYDRMFWYVAEDAGAVVGAAVWTLPHKLVLGPMPPAAARAIGAAAAGSGAPVHGAMCPVEIAHDVAIGVGASATVSMGERILVLGHYLRPPTTVGVARLVTQDDVEHAVGWLDQFTTEAGVLVVDNQAAARASLGRLWYWDVDGVPVAMAGHAAVVSTPGAIVARVGPVYTPVPLRGRGYGAAITGAVVEHLLPITDIVMLYTDSANPTSNALYERLGFAHVADVVDLDLTAPERPSGD